MNRSMDKYPAMHICTYFQRGWVGRHVMEEWGCLSAWMSRRGKGRGTLDRGWLILALG